MYWLPRCDSHYLILDKKSLLSTSLPPSGETDSMWDKKRIYKPCCIWVKYKEEKTKPGEGPWNIRGGVNIVDKVARKSPPGEGHQ